MDLSNMRIVITGGAGFIGSQLGKSLHLQGHDVVLLDNMSYGHLDNLLLDGAPFGTFLCKDIRDPALFDLIQGAEVVVHLAGIAPLPVCQANPGALKLICPMQSLENPKSLWAYSISNPTPLSRT